MQLRCIRSLGHTKDKKGDASLMPCQVAKAIGGGTSPTRRGPVAIRPQSTAYTTNSAPITRQTVQHKHGMHRPHLNGGTARNPVPYTSTLHGGGRRNRRSTWQHVSWNSILPGRSTIYSVQVQRDHRGAPRRLPPTTGREGCAAAGQDSQRHASPYAGPSLALAESEEAS